jgi:hypothetical protein
MASNKDLVLEAEGLAEELGLDIVTSGLNNKALAALVSDLEAKKKDAETLTHADDAPEAEAGAVGPVIAKGKSITSLKGILSEGAQVTPDHFAGGQETFDILTTRGFIE